MFVNGMYRCGNEIIVVAFALIGVIILCGNGRIFAIAESAPPGKRTPRPETLSLSKILSQNIECGDLCSYNFSSSKQGVFWPSLRKNFECDNVLGRMLQYEPAKDWPPPKEVPAQMLRDFTTNGLCSMSTMYITQRYSSGSALTPFWSVELIESQMTDFRNGKQIGSYGRREDSCMNSALQKFNFAVKNKTGLVVGSERPWVEVISLLNGAAQVDTLEYGSIVTKHPKMRAWLPEQFALSALKNGPSYDFAATFSSIEHSGLGRYGDALNPFGDFEVAAQVWCALKPGGLFFVAVPVQSLGTWRDCALVWNGKISLVHLNTDKE